MNHKPVELKVSAEKSKKEAEITVHFRGGKEVFLEMAYWKEKGLRENRKEYWRSIPGELSRELEAHTSSRVLHNPVSGVK